MWNSVSIARCTSMGTVRAAFSAARIDDGSGGGLRPRSGRGGRTVDSIGEEPDAFETMLGGMGDGGMGDGGMVEE